MSLPYIELHLHLDGSLSPAMARELARIGNFPLEDSSDEGLTNRLSVSEGCRDLNEYLTKFDFPGELLQMREQLSTAVSLLRQELAVLGVIYAEIRFAPQKHCSGGLSQRGVVEAAIEGLSGSGTEAGLILCCMRDENNHEENMETVRLAAEFLGQGVVAADLAGAEGLYPTKDFDQEFALACELGVPFTIHAGEAAGPKSVRTALAFGATRIGHGVRSVEDPELVAYLAQRGIPLEVCPTSNLNTGLYPSYKELPVRELLDAGVKLTINSDNTAVSRTNIAQELAMLAEAHHLTADELRLLMCNAADAVFAPDGTKARLRARILSH